MVNVKYSGINWRDNWKLSYKNGSDMASVKLSEGEKVKRFMSDSKLLPQYLFE